MQKPSLQTILVSVLIIVALFTSIYFPYKWKQLSNDFLNQTSQYGELLKQINDLQKEVGELKNGDGEVEKLPDENLETDEKDETADWKIYKNEKYRWLIKYPKNWYIRESHKPAGEFQRILFLDADENQGIVVGGGMGNITECYRTGKEKTEFPAEWMGIEIVSYLKPSNFSWDKYLRENFSSAEEYTFFTINELQGVKITKLNGILGGGDTFIFNEKILCNLRFLNDRYTDNLGEVNFSYRGRKRQEISKIFNQILSTFKFIE